MRRSILLLLVLAVPLLAALDAPLAIADDGGAPAPNDSVAPWIPPDERSPQPKSAEWTAAEPLALPRAHANCKATRLREWVRVSCTKVQSFENLMGARIIGGGTFGVVVEENWTVCATEPGAGAGAEKGDRIRVIVDRVC